MTQGPRAGYRVGSGQLRPLGSYFDPYLGSLMLDQFNDAVVWRIVQCEFKRGVKTATINHRLSVVRNLLRMARDEWQWIDTMPKVRMLGGEVERDRWLTRAEADRLNACCAPHLSPLCATPWQQGVVHRRSLNGTPRGVPLNADAVQVLSEQMAMHPRYCFTHQGEPIRWKLSNTGWLAALERAGIRDFRFHDLRHTWASWHRQGVSS